MRPKFLIPTAVAGLVLAAGPAAAQSSPAPAATGTPAVPTGTEPPQARTVTEGYPGAYARIPPGTVAGFEFGGPRHMTPEECQHQLHMSLSQDSPNIPEQLHCTGD
jgi:hypothetical protein